MLIIKALFGLIWEMVVEENKSNRCYIELYQNQPRAENPLLSVIEDRLTRHLGFGGSRFPSVYPNGKHVRHNYLIACLQYCVGLFITLRKNNIVSGKTIASPTANSSQL